MRWGARGRVQAAGARPAEEPRRGVGQVPSQHGNHRYPRSSNQERASAGLGRGGRGAHRTRPDPLVRRVGGGVRQPVSGARRRGHVRAAVRRQAPQLLSGAVGSRRRGARRGPHVHLLGHRGRSRADEQLARPGGDARDADRAVRGLDARAHDVRGAVLDGPARLGQEPRRRAADRLDLRRREHADHDAHGPGRARRARLRRRVRALPALGRHAARRRPPRTCRGRATPRTSTSSTSPTRARSGRSARATAATRCSARSASRCGSPR